MDSFTTERAVLRKADQAGDVDWVAAAHADGYRELFGWGHDFQSVVAEVLAEFTAQHDDARQAGWIAELDGQRVGSVLLVQDDETTVARLRLLFVASNARGHGIGQSLVRACTDFARASGYEAVVLWTTSNLGPALRVYQNAGFTLVKEERRPLFGEDLMSQDWRLDL
ncbi:GNAT family N-acetyltransferase [Arthrobacter sp. B0490]|uniref:GNAT family N-acetyltransferase n=1 Tax=Arthrobacter sp. B0490 TaxID=2058891 RepID=UPI000CE468EF|nr:GNAT family N-acetyltransferase [Arthrobacter sp. B0490]